MAKMGWLKKISLLKKLLAQTGPLWPDSTELAGYAEDGPYSCAECEYLKGLKAGNVFKDADGLGRCTQSVMIADPNTKKDQKGLPIINIERGCCEFVENFKQEEKT